MGEKKVFELKN